MVNNHALGFVVRNIDNILGNGRDFDDAFIARDVLIRVTFQVAGRVGAVPESLDCSYNVTLLGNDCLAKAPGPVNVFVEKIDDLRVVE